MGCLARGFLIKSEWRRIRLAEKGWNKMTSLTCAFQAPANTILNGEGENIFYDSSQTEASIFKDLYSKCILPG